MHAKIHKAKNRKFKKGEREKKKKKIVQVYALNDKCLCS